jgi:hypothetical protein
MQHVRMHGVHTAIKIDLNYFPAFSTPVIPAGIEDHLPSTLKAIPAYWHTLAAPVRPGKGTPHFRDVTLSDIDAVDANTAIEVNAAADAPIERFTLEHVHLAAQHAGSIRHIVDWRIRDARIDAADHKPLEINDAVGTRGAINP